MKRTLRTLVLPIASLVVLGAAHAEAPDVRVARVSYLGGDVSYQRGDDDDWSALPVNTPLVPGDSIYCADGGRAELQLPGGDVVRLDAGTQVDLIASRDGFAQFGVRSGYVSLRAGADSRDGGVELDTPSGAATVLEPGTYRVQVTDRGASYSVVKGRLSVAASGQQLDVDDGERLVLDGGNDSTYAFDHVDPETSFDRWAHDRDARARDSASARYVHPDVVGYQDLDDQGTWRVSARYGRVWTPSAVREGWAPYQEGRWIWQDPYGWTWVSSEPWGWAPYHYGRWVFVGGAWGWVPPPVPGFSGPAVVAEITPRYAPALVAFVGGSHWSLSVGVGGGGGAIGWVPLAPSERYAYPWEPAPRVTNNFTNITINNAVTVVNTTTFVAGPVHPIHVNRHAIVRAPVIGSTPVGIVPTHDSLCGTRRREGESRVVPHHEDFRPLVVRVAPPPRPASFKEKVVEIERTGRPYVDRDHDRDHRERIATVPATARQEHNVWRPRDDAEARRPVPVVHGKDASPRELRGRHDDHGPAMPIAAPPLAPPDSARIAEEHHEHGGHDTRVESRDDSRDGREAARPAPASPWAKRNAPPVVSTENRTEQTTPARSVHAWHPTVQPERPAPHSAAPARETRERTLSEPAHPAHAEAPVSVPRPANPAQPQNTKPSAAASEGRKGKPKEHEKEKDANGHGSEPEGH